MYRPVDVVEVRAWGATVGAVALDPKIGYYVFEYDRAWQNRKIELAPLTMPLSQATHVFPSLPEATFKRLPSMLADSLPDDFGNALIESYLAREGVAKSAITSLDRLAYMGTRGMGALEFKPARGPQTRKSTAIEMSEMVTASRRALQGSFDGAESSIHALIQVGTSAGGARAKVVVAWNNKTNRFRSGQLPAEPGFEHWIVKLDGVGADHELGGTKHYGRIEYAYSLMASEAGITMSPCRLFEENGRAHFMTQRWDRIANEKIHAQTLCAMMHLDYRQKAAHDYAQYFEAITRLGLPRSARDQAFRRMVLNVLAYNRDDHSKNFSFIMNRDGQWRLAPAYDVTYAYNPQGEWTYQHLMSVNGKFHSISRSDIEAMGDRFEVPAYAHIVRETIDAVAHWPEFAQKAGLPESDTKRIQADLVKPLP